MAALTSTNPALVTIKVAKGVDAVKVLLSSLIANGLKYFNVGKGMTPEQIVLTTDLIVAEYGYFKPDEVAMVFRYAVNGKFGQIYDRIDSAVIMGWFAEFDNLRTIEAENISIKASKVAANQLNILSYDNIPPTIKQGLKTLLNENEQKTKELQKKEPNEKELMIQRWLMQFDRLYLRSGINSPIRMVNRYGRVLDVSAFIEHKFEQYFRFLDNNKK